MRITRGAVAPCPSRAPGAVLLGICLFGLPVLLTPAGCGSGHSHVTAASGVGITLGESTVTVSAGGNATLTATVTNSTNQSVTYAVKETNGGTITSAGLYTAPLTAGTYHVIVTSAADSSATATVTITVTEVTATPTPSPTPTPTPSPTPTPAVVTVTISPTSATLAIGASGAFAATVSGASDTSVTYSVQEGTTGGTITTTGVYTAPSTAGTYHVVATSNSDSTKTAVATVTVQSGTSSVTVH